MVIHSRAGSFDSVSQVDSTTVPEGLEPGPHFRRSFSMRS